MVVFIVRKKSVYVSSSDVLLVEVKHCYIGIVFKDHTGYNLITNIQRLACAVLLDILTHLYYFSGTFMSESNRNESERIAFKLMRIGSADAAALNLNKNIIVSYFGKLIFVNVKVSELCKHCNSCGFRYFAGSGLRSRSCCGNGSVFHIGNDLLYNSFDIV